MQATNQMEFATESWYDVINWSHGKQYIVEWTGLSQAILAIMSVVTNKQAVENMPVAHETNLKLF